VTETAPSYNAAKEQEKRLIAEKMVASLGLTFVHLKHGRVYKELGKDKVVKKTMRELVEEGKKLPNGPPVASNVGETAIVPSNAGETAIAHSAPPNTGVTWNEAAMQALTNQQRPVSFTNVAGGGSVTNQHFAGDYKHTVNNYTNDNSLDLGIIIKQQLGDIKGKLDSNREEWRSIIKEHKEKVDHLEETVSVQDRIIKELRARMVHLEETVSIQDRVIKELRARMGYLEETLSVQKSNQKIMRVNDKENERGAEINALREVQQDEPTSSSKRRNIRNRDDADVSELEDETMSC